MMEGQRHLQFVSQIPNSFAPIYSFFGNNLSMCTNVFPLVGQFCRLFGLALYSKISLNGPQRLFRCVTPGAKRRVQGERSTLMEQCLGKRPIVV